MKNRFENFTGLISSISKSIRKIKTEEVEEYNLKSTHVSCLYYIYKTEELTAKELCDLCGEDKALISRSLDFLETNGFIQCNSTLKKRYKSGLILTEKGSEVAKKITQKIDQILNLASNGLTEENRKIMYESLSIINSNLQTLCNNYKGE